MSIRKFTCLLFIVMACTNCLYGQVWKKYVDSAKIFKAQKKIDKSVEYYGKVIIELKKDSAGTKSYAVFCDSLALLFASMQQYDKAVTLFLESKQIQERLVGKDNPDYARYCYNLGYFYYRLGKYREAESIYLEAKQVREKLWGKENRNYANCCQRLAILYHDMGQYDKALMLFIEDKQIREKISGKESVDYAVSCGDLATLYTQIGQYERAEPLFLEAMQIEEKLSAKSKNYANYCNNLANLYMQMGQYQKAEALHLKSKQITEELEGKENPNYALSCFNLADCYLNMGKYQLALPLNIEAKDIAEKTISKEDIRYIPFCYGLGNIYRKLGQYKKAEPLLQEALQKEQKIAGRENTTYAGFCDCLANLYCSMGQYDKAWKLYLEARQILLRGIGKRHPDYAQYCEDLAKFYWQTSRPLQAEREFEELFVARASNLFDVFRFTNEKEKADYIGSVSGEDGDAYSFYVSKKIKSGIPYSLSIYHRNLILSSTETLKKNLFSTTDTSFSNKYSDWISLKKQLSVLYSQPGNERKEDVAKIENTAGLLEKELSKLSAAFENQQQQIGWKDIQNKLKADEASIEFVSFQFNSGKRLTDTVMYAAVLLRKNLPLPITVPLFNEKQLTDIIAYAGSKATSGAIEKLYTLNNRGTENDKRVAKKSMYNLIWKPLEQKLDGIKTVYFAPSGLLHRIAIAALPINSKEVLSDRYKLVQLATTASLVERQIKVLLSDTDKITLYGGIDYDVDTTGLKNMAIAYHRENVVNRSIPDDITRGKGWGVLPGTKKEIESIISLSGKYRTDITAISGRYATEESLKALNGVASPAVLHIATHGFFFPDPKMNKSHQNFENGATFKASVDPLIRSGLLFAGANSAWRNSPGEGIDDGILTAYEISNLYLPNTKLVVLSACETGLGEIHGSEGVYGLQRAFKIAGVQNLIMSLWKVSDLETAEFMEEFYKNLFARKDIGDAFYGAQKTLKNKYRLQPYKWAAWVLVR